MGKFRPPQAPFGAVLRAAIDNHSVGRRFMLYREESGEKLPAATITRDLILQNKLCHLRPYQQSPKKALIGLPATLA